LPTSVSSLTPATVPTSLPSRSSALCFTPSSLVSPACRNWRPICVTQEAQERDLERELLAHLRQFLIELGVGFAFVGSQVPLEVGGEDFKLDLLSYHLKLRCFVVIDLKMTPFKPEYAGKMNFYPLSMICSAIPTISGPS